MIYLDTSALVKRFVAEAASDRIRRLIVAEASVATSKIAYAEIYSGLTRKWRENDLSKSDHALACRQFEMDWEAYVRVELHDEILVLSRDLIQRHPLRGFDAVHVASAVYLQKALGEPMSFVAADKRLLEAAHQESLFTVDVTT
ncbi:MAG: type II toxin-antitoxin system VapC family toxin [Vicinamibacteria bacterium]